MQLLGIQNSKESLIHQSSHSSLNNHYDLWDNRNFNPNFDKFNSFGLINQNGRMDFQNFIMQHQLLNDKFNQIENSLAEKNYQIKR